MVTGVRPKVYVVNFEHDQQLGARLSGMKLDFERFESADAFFSAADPLVVGCVIANLQEFGVVGIDLLQRLNADNSSLPLVLLSEKVSSRLVVRVMRQGAFTVLEEPVNDDELFFAIRESLQESEKRLTEKQEITKLLRRFDTITSPECQVLDVLCAGYTNKQIAASLDVSVRTVEARKKRILQKTGYESIPELVIGYHGFKTTVQRSDDDLDGSKFRYAG